MLWSKAAAGRFAADRSGNLATLAALTMPIAVVLAAVAVDEASLYAERRQAQALVDLASITAAANIGNAEAAVAMTLRDNGLPDFVLADVNVAPGTQSGISVPLVTVTRGRYTASSTTAAWQRFEPGRQPYNGVRVSLRKQGSLFFGGSLIERPEIATEATASATAEAAFSVGSRLLRVEGGILNAVLGGLLGANLTLSVMDYEALISTEVSVFSFLDALATRINITGGTYDDVLQSQATVGQIAAAIASVQGIDQQSRLALQVIAGSAGSNVTVPLDHLVDLGSFGRLALGEQPAGMSAAASVMDILTASAAVANGQHQVQLNLGASIPGILGARLDLAIGEPAQMSPWFAIGGSGQIVRTAQTRALLTVELAGVLGVSIKLPVYIELAFAEAKLTDISCPGGRPDSLRVRIAARPGIASLRVAEVGAATLGDFRNQPAFAPAKILQAPLVTVTGQAFVEMANASYTTLNFNRQDIADRTIKTVSTRNFTQSLTQSLLGNLHLQVSVAGLGLGLPSNLTGTVGNILGAATPAVDTLLYSVLSALGVRLGEADIRLHGATCSRSVLVQ